MLAAVVEAVEWCFATQVAVVVWILKKSVTPEPLTRLVSPRCLDVVDREIGVWRQASFSNYQNDQNRSAFQHSSVRTRNAVDLRGTESDVHYICMHDWWTRNWSTYRLTG